MSAIANTALNDWDERFISMAKKKKATEKKSEKEQKVKKKAKSSKATAKAKSATSARSLKSAAGSRLKKTERKPSAQKKEAPPAAVATPLPTEKEVPPPEAPQKPAPAAAKAKPSAVTEEPSTPKATPSSKLPPPRPLQPVRPPPASLQKPQAKARPLTQKDLEMFKEMLLRLRDRVIDEIEFLSRDNLNRSQRDSAGDLSSYSFHMADQGTDNFDREFAANLLSSEQDILYEIDEALRRIENGTYGICEKTGQPIEYERLKVIPFARYCVAAQAEMEKGKPRYRPFRRTSIQATMEPQS